MLIKKIDKELIEKSDALSILKSIDLGVNLDMDFLRLFISHYKDENKLYQPKMTFYDTIELSDEQKKVFRTSSTTVGRLIFNAFVLNSKYINKFGFMNKQIDSGVYSDVHDNMALLLTNKEIDTDEYSKFMNRITWLGMSLTNYRGLCMDYKSITMSDNFMNKKSKVYKELQDKNATNEEVLQAESDLIDEAKKEKAGTGLYETIKSGSKGNFANNYKNLNIARGIIITPDGKSRILDRSLSEGNRTSEYVHLSNNSIQGSYGRSLKTAQGGYLVKLITSGFSYIELSKNEDCGCKEHLNIKINQSNFRIYLYRKVRQKGRHNYETITPDNYKDFIGKELEMRSPLFCKNRDGLCRTCYGDLWKVNKMETGFNVLISDLGSTVMNKAMKSFHDLTVKYFTVNIKEEIEKGAR